MLKNSVYARVHPGIPRGHETGALKIGLLETNCIKLTLEILNQAFGCTSILLSAHDEYPLGLSDYSINP